MVGRSAGRQPLPASLTGVAGVLAVILEHVSDALVDVAIPVYFAAIVFLLAWTSLIARRLWQRSTS